MKEMELAASKVDLLDYGGLVQPCTTRMRWSPEIRAVYLCPTMPNTTWFLILNITVAKGSCFEYIECHDQTEHVYTKTVAILSYIYIYIYDVLELGACVSLSLWSNLVLLSELSMDMATQLKL